MNPGATDKGGCGMAEMAVQRGRKMIVILTSGCNPVAGRAIINNTGMIKYRSDEGTGVMTDTTILVRRYMVVRFTDGESTIMAGATVIHDANMIKGRRYKTRSLVAVAAISVGWHMVWWRNFSSGGCTIVARRTVIEDALMIESCIGKDRSNMAHGTVLRRGNMIL
jgi:hypothetical protein